MRSVCSLAVLLIISVPVSWTNAADNGPGAPSGLSASASPSPSVEESPSPWASAGVPLFRLTRNMNANEVIYEVRPQEASPGDFIHAYWRMFAKSKSGPTEELTFLESKFGYSADKVRIDEDVVKFVIRALPSYELAVKIDFAKAPQATVALLGSTCVIERVHLEASGGIWPEVHWAEIDCRAPARRVRLTPLADDKSKSRYKESLQ